MVKFPSSSVQLELKEAQGSGKQLLRFFFLRKAIFFAAKISINKI